MKCKKFETWILRSLDGRLTEGEEDRLQRHLKICSLCRQKQREYKTLLILLSQEKQPEPKPYFWERLLEEIKEQKAHSFWLAVKRWSLRAVPLSLLIVFLMALAVILFSPPQDQELSQSEVLLLRNMNPLHETQLLLEERAENQNMMLIFSSLEEKDSTGRKLP